MVKQYYEAISHTNTVDTEVEVHSLESTTEEPKKIIAIGLIKDTNGGILRGYHERDNFLEFPTGDITDSGLQEIPVDVELPVGESFLLTLQNATAGTNAALIGYIKYEITA